jgi:hypothetical protein
MPRTSKKGKKASGASSKAVGSSSAANGESPSVGARQNEVAVNGVAGASASPSEQTRVMGARMSGVKHSGLLAKDGKEK